MISSIKYVIIILALLQTAIAENLNVRADSLSAQLRTSENGDKIDVLLRLAELRLNDQPGGALELSRRALELSWEAGDEILAAKSLRKIAKTYYFLAYYDRAVDYYGRSLVKFLENNRETEAAKTMIGLGRVYALRGKYDLAVEYLNKSAKYFSEIGDKSNFARAALYIGDIYFKWKSFSAAANYYAKALAQFDIVDDSIGIADCFCSMGLMEVEKGDYDSAFVRFDNSLKIYGEFGALRGVSRCLENIGQARFESGDAEKAVEALTESMKIVKRLDDRKAIARLHMSLARIRESAGDPENAVKHAEAALVIAKENRDLDLKIEAFSFLAEFFEKSGALDKSVKYYRMRSLLKDSIFDEETSRALKEIEFELELETIQKEDEIRKLELASQRNIFIGVSAAALVLILALLYRYYQNKTSGKILENKNLEIQAANEKLTSKNDELARRGEELTALLDELAEREARLQAYIDNTVAGVVEIQSDGSIQYANPTFANMLGYSCEEVLNYNYFDLTYSKDLDAESEAFNSLFKNGLDSFSIEKRFLHIRGDAFWSDASVSAIKNEKRGADSAIVVAINIDVRKRIETELKKKNQFQQILINSIPAPMYFKDVNQRYIECNAPFAEFVGARREEIIGKTSADFFPPEIAEKFRVDDEKILREKSSVSEKRVLTLDGVRKQYLVNKTAFYDRETEPAGIIGVFADITEIGEIQAALERSEQNLIKANAAKDKFLSIIAHDLKNPLQSIILASELLVKLSGKIDKNTLKMYSANINESARNLSDLLENLLQWSRAQRNKLRVFVEEFDAAAVVNEEINLYSLSAEEKDVVLYSETELNSTVFADRNMVRTVVRNLISNALKFTPSGGEVKVSSRLSGDFLEIEVRDSGVGIEPENIDKLFDPDQFFSKPGARNEKGTGLGLILCKEFVAKNGGQIRAESELGKGSAFVFTIPVKNPE